MVAVIEFADVTVRRGSTTLLDTISWRVAAAVWSEAANAFQRAGALRSAEDVASRIAHC